MFDSIVLFLHVYAMLLSCFQISPTILRSVQFVFPLAVILDTMRKENHVFEKFILHSRTMLRLVVVMQVVEY